MKLDRTNWALINWALGAAVTFAIITWGICVDEN